MRDEPPEDTLSSRRANGCSWFPQSDDAFHGTEALKLEVAGFVAERQTIGQIAIGAGAVNRNSVHVRPHGPPSKVHQRKKNLRAFVVVAAGGPAAGLPKNPLGFFLPGGNAEKNGERVQIHHLMRGAGPRGYNCK